MNNSKGVLYSILEKMGREFLDGLRDQVILIFDD